VGNQKGPSDFWDSPFFYVGGRLTAQAQNRGGGFAVNVIVLAKGPAVGFHARLHLLGGFLGVDAVSGERGGHAQAVEESRGGLDGLVNAVIVFLGLDAQHAVAVLQQFALLLLAFDPQQPGQHCRWLSAQVAAHIKLARAL